MSQTSRGVRVGAFMLAVLFLVSSVGISVGVFFLVRREQAAINRVAQLTPEEQAAQQTQDNKENKDMLQGTKLENFSPIANVTELQIIDLVVGTGKAAEVGSTITAHYTGALVSDGTIFQSSKDTGEPFKTKVVEGGLIDGWVKGIPGMMGGGKRRLVIPAAMAYGERSQSGIPANSALVFDIEMVSVE